jgi:hypothetical protein
VERLSGANVIGFLLGAVCRLDVGFSSMQSTTARGWIEIQPDDVTDLDGRLG